MCIRDRPKITSIVAERDSIDGFSNYLFDDLNVKTNFRVGKSDRFYLSYYSGRDDFENEKLRPEFRDSFPTQADTLLIGTFFDSNRDSLKWGNQLVSLRWNHLFGDKIFANTTAYLSQYKFTSSEVFRSVGIYDNGRKDLVFSERVFNSEIRDLGLRSDVEYLYSDRLNFKFGVGTIHHSFRPGSFENGTDLKDVPIPVLALDTVNLSVENQLNIEEINSNEVFTYIESGISLNRKFYLTVGLHAKFWKFEDFQDLSVLPRFNLDYKLNDNFSLSATYLEIAQHLHLLTKSDIGLPGDIWVPASEKVRPETATPVSYTHLTLPTICSV